LKRRHPKELKQLALGLVGVPNDAEAIIEALKKHVIETGKLPQPDASSSTSSSSSPSRRRRGQGASSKADETLLSKEWAMSLMEHSVDVDDLIGQRVVHAAHCLGCNPNTLFKLLTERRMSRKLAGGKVEEFFIPLEGDEKTYARDAVIKAIYQSLFQWVVNTINDALVPNYQG
jgi:hypothetical protein